MSPEVDKQKELNNLKTSISNDVYWLNHDSSINYDVNKKKIRPTFAKGIASCVDGAQSGLFESNSKDKTLLEGVRVGLVTIHNYRQLHYLITQLNPQGAGITQRQFDQLQNASDFIRQGVFNALRSLPVQDLRQALKSPDPDAAISHLVGDRGALTGIEGYVKEEIKRIIKVNDTFVTTESPVSPVKPLVDTRSRPSSTVTKEYSPHNPIDLSRFSRQDLPDDIRPLEIDNPQTFSEMSVDQLADSILIINEYADNIDLENQEEVIDLTQELGNDFSVKIAVTAQENNASANVFYNVLRHSLSDILGHPVNRNYESGNWFNAADLVLAADRWNIPLFMMKIDSESHYVLGLDTPQYHNDQWRVLVYDPMSQGERWQTLSDWKPGNCYYSAPRGISLVFNETGRQAVNNEDYHISVSGDQEIADHADIIAAKMGRIQFDGRNCGPACLFAAAVRWGMKEGPNEFKEAGRDKLAHDTGLRVHLREEILGQAPAQWVNIL